MFDNEIDWVTCCDAYLFSPAAVRLPDKQVRHQDTRLNTRPSTCKELLQVSNSGKCSM